MNAWVFALLPAVVGVDYGWERKPDGSIVYIIQVEPEAVESMKTGAELVGALPPELRNITNYKIRLGRDRLPNHNQLPPEITRSAVVPPPSAFPGTGGVTQPLSGTQPLTNPPPGSPGYNATSNYQTQPNYATQPNYVGAPAAGQFGATAGGQPTSTSGFTMAGSNPLYGTQSGVGSPTTGGTGFVNNGLNYGQPNYSQPNPAAPNYPTQQNPGGYVWNPATGTYGPPATATLPTGVIAPTGSTSAGGWAASNPPVQTQPTYGVGTQQPNYVAPPALGPAAGQPANWASNPNANYYGTSPPAGAAGPGIPGIPEYQNVGRQSLDGTQPNNFVNTGATNAGANAVMPQANRTAEPPSASTGSAASPPAPAESEKSLGLMSVLIGLFASLAFNLWCGWNLYNIRERYRSLLSERAPAY